MTVSFQGKVAIVTGAATGIGRASAAAFAAQGARVVVADVDDAGGTETVAQIAEANGEASFFHCDVSDETAARELVHFAVSNYGRLDFAHNNAGISPDAGDVVACSKDSWDRIVGINLTGVWLGMKFQIPEMLRAGGGAIVNTSSVAALAGRGGKPAYAASKWGIIGVTKSAARDYAGKKIRINAICPGSTDTPMLRTVLGDLGRSFDDWADENPMGRVASADEIAATVIWLCSDAASFVTGIALPVEGGMAI